MQHLCSAAILRTPGPGKLVLAYDSLDAPEVAGTNVGERD